MHEAPRYSSAYIFVCTYYVYIRQGMSEVVKSYVLNRTLGDVLCDNTELNEIQKWVTLQPDEGYNPQVQPPPSHGDKCIFFYG